MESLIEIIKKTQKTHPSFSMRLSEAEALGRWQAAVGDLIAKHSRAIRVYQSTLWVEVEHPIWRSELHYRKQQILDILNGKEKNGKGLLSFTGTSPQAPFEPLKDIQFIDPKSRRG